MINLSAIDGRAQRFRLVPDARVTRGGKAKLGVAPISAFIEITEPLVTPVTKALVADDAALAAFWGAEKGRFHYDYVTFRCTLIPADGAPFEKAWLEVDLEPRAEGRGPIAYSMEPDKIVDVKTLSDSVKLGADLKLVSSEAGTTIERKAEDYVLRAWREQTAQPYWAFNRTDTVPLTGTFRFHLVTRTPADIEGSGRLTARAVVARRTFWIFESEASAGAPASLTFSLRHSG
jgi:hypothetical protein